ncbi:MAG TPA: hypothetical protein DIW47_02100 [Bacteroidetes bacterium]|nr:hypothetical protein [Bacteroidota bacterium]
MDENIFAYFELLEVMAFFAGYAILYAFVHVLADLGNIKFKEKIRSIIPLLPLSYVLTGLLFLGYLIKGVLLVNNQADGPIQIHIPLLHYVGLLSLLFWIPFFRKRAWLSLVHSLFFFSYICLDLVKYLRNKIGVEILQNDMKVLLDGVLISFFSLLCLVLLSYAWARVRKGRA